MLNFKQSENSHGARKTSIIFLVSFLLNVVWENLHSYLYANYMGENITQFILVRASLFDALLITLISLPFLYFNSLKYKVWIILIPATIIAVINEWYGLGTARWAYNELMPIIPILNTGITPTIQLGLLAYFSFKIEEYLS